jgi:PAS domain S-box-containing protein
VGERPARILIVDDERADQQLLEVILASEGFDLVTAATGAEALAMVALTPPDLIVLDVIMPGIDGYQVADTIKGDPATRNIPIIMVTSLADHDAKMLGLSAGAEDILTKPVNRTELCMRVRNLLRLKAHGDYYDKHSQMLEAEVQMRTADLRQERDRAQRYLDTAAIILLALDDEGRITLINRHGCALLGWTADELLGRDWIETCIPVRSREQTGISFRNLMGGDTAIVENLILTKAGEERLIEWRNTLVRDAAGLAVGTFSSGADVTDRSRAMETLRATEERMRFGMEAAGIGIWDMDYTTGALRWSETIEAHYGFDPGTFGGTFDSFTERIHPDDREAVLAIIAAAAGGGTDFTQQHRSLWPDGTVRWLSGAGRFLLDAKGTLVRGIGISQDVTERHNMERQYQEAQKMEAVGRLASGVAHDFNNLLSVILGCAELMRADEHANQQHGEDLGEIIKATRRAAGLTKQLLAFGRQQVLHSVALDVNGLIEDMTGMLDRLIGSNIDVALALAPNLAAALADRSQLEQVVMNLVVNARDAMPDGGRISIQTTDVELDSTAFHDEAAVPGHYVMIAVTDTGTGMSQETQRRLFEPFFTTKEPGKGTGLGLSTTYGIVKQSKGYLWVYSELGRGTTFKVYLPRATPALARQAAPAEVGAALLRAGETVLLVEDEAGVRRLSKRILGQAGYRVLEAANSDDAERLYAHHGNAIDLLVTDVNMPGRGGPELVGRLKRQAPELRVLYMSGNAEHASAHPTRIDHASPFVQKPFTAAELVRRVREALAP